MTSTISLKFDGLANMQTSPLTDISKFSRFDVIARIMKFSKLEI